MLEEIGEKIGLRRSISVGESNDCILMRPVSSVRGVPWRRLYRFGRNGMWRVVETSSKEHCDGARRIWVEADRTHVTEGAWVGYTQSRVPA